MPKSGPESTRAALIAAAEHLFGTKGIDRVATREILELAGQKNQSALQYHFKDRAGLIWAVLDARLAKIEARRAILVAALPPAGEETCAQLIETFVRPLTEVVLEDEQGSAYVQFVAQSAHRPKADLLATMEDGRYPAMLEVSKRIDGKLSHLPAIERPMRKRMIVSMGVGAVSLWDAKEKDKLDVKEFIGTAVAATVPLLEMPSMLAKRAAE